MSCEKGTAVNSSKEYLSQFGSCKLTVKINPKNHVIDYILLDEYDNDIYIKSIMKAFSEVIYGLPILEANDHGVLRLENLLRDDDVVHPIKGIVMPRNSCELFEIPTKLIRAVYDQYTQEENYHPLANTYCPKEIQEWKNLDIKEREKIVSEKINNFCIVHKIEEYDAKLIGDMRVEFAADKDKYPSLAKLLFDMETIIDKELGFSLEIMFTEKQDANKKRKTRGEQL